MSPVVRAKAIRLGRIVVGLIPLGVLLLAINASAGVNRAAARAFDGLAGWMDGNRDAD